MNKWTERFLNLSDNISNWSKDSTKVGAVITTRDNRIVSIGYNGFPAGCNDDKEERKQRPLKYLWTEHAERNAIYNACKTGANLTDTIIYLRWFPCADCARGIIQSGIKKVVCGRPDLNTPKWGEHFKVSLEMFEECSIEVVFSDE